MIVRERVRRFLLEFKKAVEESGIDLVPRHDGLETLRYLQLTFRNFQEELLGLAVEDYSSGPEKDRGKSGELWVFGKEVVGHEIYIKIKLVVWPEGCRAKCISFHIARGPLKYPLKPREK